MQNVRLLRADEIEVKVKQITEKGAVVLLYKTARTDMTILDETYGAENWTDAYKEIKGNLYCGIGVRNNKDDPFVWKWNCGTESREDGDGNEKKGEASDAFKRAAVLWGIGRELYTAPFTFIRTATKETARGKYELGNRYERYAVKEIGYDERRCIDHLILQDNEENVVFRYGARAGEDNPPLRATPAPKTEAETTAGHTVKRTDPRQEHILKLIKGTTVTNEKVAELIQRASEGKTSRVAELSERDYNRLCGVLEGMIR